MTSISNRDMTNTSSSFKLIIVTDFFSGTCFFIYKCINLPWKGTLMS